MAKVSKLHRNSADKTLEDAMRADLAECVVIGKTKGGEVICYYGDDTTAETMAVAALIVQDSATRLLIDDDQ
jgi:hypothetical protein